MDNNTSSFILYTYRKPLIALVTAIVLIAALMLIISKLDLFTNATPPAPEGAEVVVTEATAEDIAALSPYLYFSALGQGEGGVPELHTYAYDLATGIAEPVSLYDGDHSFSYVDQRHALFVGRSWEQLDETHPDNWTPLWSDYGDGMHGLITTVAGWNEQDLVAHPDGAYIAFSQQPDRVDDTTSRALSSWEVVIAKPESGEVRRIKEASSPVWVGEDHGLVYLKADGVYYTTAQGTTETKIFDGYHGLTRNADLAATADGSYLVVTVPGARSLEVLQVEQFELGAVSVVYTTLNEDVVYRHPIFDRQGTHFAVVYFKEGVPVIEIRNVTSEAVIGTLTMSEFTEPYFALNDWTDVLITAAQYGSAAGADSGHAGDDHHEGDTHE